MTMHKKIKAVGLLSGGLDSALACRMLMEQGIDVHLVYIAMPWGCGKPHRVLALAEKYQCPLKIISIQDDYLSILKQPKYGFGSAHNPCVDCHIYMVKKAADYMREIKASFIFTGEVLGQRPMSQRRVCLDWVEKEAGVEGLLLRPLSALSLEPTIPEKEGWVDRQKLLNITGRGRKQQYTMAEVLGLEDFSQPGGGCLLTENHFAQRIKDVLACGCSSIEQTRILGIGRYKRFDEHTFILLGRDDRENKALIQGALKTDKVFIPHSFLGPVALMRSNVSYDQETLMKFIYQIGQWMLQYSKAKGLKGQKIANVQTKEIITI